MSIVVRILPDGSSKGSGSSGASLVALCFATLLLKTTTVDAQQPPNIVIILIDDYGHTDIGYHNEKYDNLIKTPTLDRLAQDGVKLESYYVQPICTPTRSQLLSGRYQIHTGLQHGVIHPGQPYGLPTDIPLLTNHLIRQVQFESTPIVSVPRPRLPVLPRRHIHLSSIAVTGTAMSVTRLGNGPLASARTMHTALPLSLVWKSLHPHRDFVLSRWVKCARLAAG
eukprot:SAG11_NODE_7730_length_1103_cov_1.098606_1_plen_225_part_00